MSGTPRQLIIAGGGASGTLLALHLLRADTQCNWSITLAERHSVAGAGLAYSTNNRDHHLLNVRVKQLSVDSAQPDDFLHWLTANNRRATPNDFVPRHWFGAYLTARLQEAIAVSNGRLQVLPQELIAAQPTASGWQLTAANGQELKASHLVLACGNLLPDAHKALTPGVQTHPAYEANPWHYDTLNGLSPEASVVLIGSGLTMADWVSELHARGHRGQVLSVSPHGFLPAVHQAPQPAWPDFGHALLAAKTLQAQLRLFRQQLQRAAAQEVGWTAVTDSLRPWLQPLWLQADEAWRTQFMQHVRHLWGVARHRLPPATAANVQALVASGQLRIEAGRVQTLVAENQNISVAWMPRGKQQAEVVVAQKVINCTGPSARYATQGPALLHQLFREQHLRADRSGLGVDALPNGTLIGASGQPHPNLFALGPMIRGVLWEITAIPEIRKQVQELAQQLCESGEA